MNLKQTLLIALSCWLTVGCKEKIATPHPQQTPVNQTTQVDPPPSEADEEAPAETPKPIVDEKLVAKFQEFAKDVSLNSNGQINKLTLVDTELSQENLSLVVELQHLESLALQNVKITDDDLKLIGQIKTLRNLDLRNSPVSNDGLAHLTGLTGLRALRLSGQNGETTVDDGGMESVGKLTNLKALLLDFLWVSGEGLSQLEGLKNLEELYLAGTLVGDEDLQQMSLFPNLKKLRISKLSQVTGAGLEHVKKLPNLIDLDLSENSSMFDADMVHLTEMTKLQRLNLWRVAITDTGVAPLEKLSDMKWLNLDNT
ncbi:MAG: hypothetical protein HON04_14660, partial [Planctomicrobium sp.]|nr:hypothetical protein [Planctomicrobium sp.]